MSRAYRNRIAASKGRLDAEMRVHAATLTGTPSERLDAMVSRFPAIVPAYAVELLS